MADILIHPDSMAGQGDDLRRCGGVWKMRALVGLLSELPTGVFNGFRLYADFGVGSVHEDGGTRWVVSRMINFVGESPDVVGMSLLFKWRGHVLPRLVGVDDVFAEAKDFVDDGEDVGFWIKRNPAGGRNYSRFTFDRSEFLERLGSFCLEVTQNAINNRKKDKQNG